MAAGRLTAVAAALAGLLAGVLATPGPAVSEPSGLLVDGCIVRLLAAGPQILDDAVHECSDRVSGVSLAANGDLVIAHGAVAEVVACTVAIDETLASRGVIAGASAGLSSTIVRFYDTGTGASVRADSTAVVGSTSNIFVTWLSVPEVTP